jgi:glutathione S-transferase
MRLYHHPFSSNGRRAVMTALHLGVKLDLVVVDLAKGEQRRPDFLKMNPNGRVPVLDDDGFFLNESHAIMAYLADKTPGQTLYPSELKARADVNRWLFWSAQHFQPAVAVLNWERNVKALLNLGPADPKEEARGERLVGECAKVLDEHLAGKEWVAQGRLTLADIALATSLMVQEHVKLSTVACPNIQAWLGRVKALDAWKKTSL